MRIDGKRGRNFPEVEFDPEDFEAVFKHSGPVVVAEQESRLLVWKAEVEAEDYHDSACMMCGKEDGELLLCDGVAETDKGEKPCTNVCHAACASLDAVPDGDWLCLDCSFVDDSEVSTVCLPCAVCVVRRTL